MITALVTAYQGHDHVLTVPVSIGPLILRVALLTAVPAIAGFAVLRGFVPETGRAATAMVAASAVGAIVLELMLSAGLALPPQLVVLLLALSSAPLWLVLSRDERKAKVVAFGRACAPWIVVAAAVAAFVAFGRAWPVRPPSEPLMHTAIVFALTGLSWFTVCRPAGAGPARVALRVVATALALAALAGTAYAITARPLERAAGSPPAINATTAYNGSD
ncbi:DUF6239 family natural product biosynthesis protein [Kibdelosporangium phytohabitans]|uniref:DUF6239 family natural product biosynthesis protein n=1 Tax=Kibdelosporangium phytohabitans TaxID=860235 RepID=UPI0012FAC07D|nr:DUF6239 family natural product biosynthesis protein [Kibdelosporangium phytohabitans]MBE1461921.1 lysylphosphatidylglycerol synthetase-like protein (DUF2156 family) [Kibdelosporangium phytohabitans]